MNLLESYRAITIDTIHKFIEERQEENLTLDFKTVADPSMSKNDRKNFAKCLSGFSNSSGGIVVWGVEACKREDEADFACGLPGIDDAILFLTKLNEHTGSSVSPIINGVLHDTILTDDGKYGFAKSYIPESDFPPHMSRYEQIYYKRSGDSFYKMEHFDIADMFGKSQKPILDLIYDIRQINGPKGTLYSIYFGLKNNGRGTAKAPYISISSSPLTKKDPYGLDGNGRTGLNYLIIQSKHGTHAYGANSKYVIHPGVTIMIDTLNTEIIDHKNEYSVVVDYSVAAEDCPITNKSIQIKLQ